MLGQVRQVLHVPPAGYVQGPRKRGLVTMVLPRQAIPGAKDAYIADPATRATVERINRMLASRIQFKVKVEALFLEIAGVQHKLKLDGLKKFTAEFCRRFDISEEAFDNPDVWFVYDFSGDEEYQFNEAYKLVKDKLCKYRARLGGKPVIDVPRKTLETAGYKIIKELAAGGQGSANLAKTRDGEMRVLKKYDKDNANAASIDDLKEEMENMKTAEHPNIAICHEIFQDTLHLFMVSDPYMGKDFETIQQNALDVGVDLTEDWYRGVFKQVFKGLQHLHKKCIVHCDIKEPNIMVKEKEYEQPDVVIIDLGLAASLKPLEARVCGTPGYMPPETWEYGAWLPTGDVFSMGVTMCQMLTGNIPNPRAGVVGIFQHGRDMQQIMQCVTNEEPPIDDMDTSEFSDEFRYVIETCLEKKYFDRPTPTQVLEMPFFGGEGKRSLFSICGW